MPTSVPSPEPESAAPGNRARFSDAEAAADAGAAADVTDSTDPTDLPLNGSPLGFRPLGEKVEFKGWRISVVTGTFESPDGRRFTREIVRHPGAVAIVPVTDSGTALLIRQYRGPVDRELLEIPAGTRDVEGETPEETASRELEEEVGVRAGRLELLAEVLNTPGFCDEQTWVYLATELTASTAKREGEEERYIEVVEVGLDRVESMIGTRRLTDAQTVIGLLLARDALSARGVLPSGHSAPPSVQ
jgi:8-oxo-dGTP pyrophosphatase MutT (NUDIX family)